MGDFSLDTVIQTMADLVTTWGLKVVGAIVLFVVGRIMAGWARC